MTKNILLTGANGFVGSFFLKNAIKTDYNFIILVRENSNLYRIEDLIKKNNQIVKLYKSDTKNLPEIFERNKIDSIVHLATNYIKEDNYSDIQALIDSNITFPSHLLELSKIYNIKGFINTGTFFEYDQQQTHFNERTKIQPYNFYAKTKLMFQDALEAYSKDFNSTTLKLFSPYGPMDNNKVIPYIISSIIKDKEIILSNPNESCDFTFVEDITSAFIKTLDKLNSGKLPKNINICSGVYTTISELVATIESLMQKKANISYKCNNSISIKSSSIRVAKNEINWEPKNSLRDGLKNTIKYYEGLYEI